MTLKETFIENLSKITSGMKQKEIAKIMGCTEGTVSKYLNKNKTDFPTVEMILNLSQHFNISVDWLLGNKSTSEKKSFSPRDICKFLVDINKTCCYFSFGEFTATEECYIPQERDGQIYGTDYQVKDNTYIALYFPKWCELRGIKEEDFMLYRQVGNNSLGNAYINLFLSRFKEISDMFKKGNLTQEMYDRLLDSYLNDVPD